MSQVEWIAVDWGTTNLRAWALAEDGSVLESAQRHAGMDRLSECPSEYESALLGLIDPWLSAHRRTVILACGMAGSRQGWIEAPYRPTPAATEDANAIVEAPTRDTRIQVHIAGGICQNSPQDVMRGEETILAGLSRFIPNLDGTAILPGTHTKWVRVAGGKVQRFTTFMTGELFGLLTGASILRHSVSPEGLDADAFASAFAETLAAPESLSARLFTLRASHLLNGADPVASSSRLSGFLTGLEFAGAASYREAKEFSVIASGMVAERYRIAFNRLGVAFRMFDPEECVLEGLRATRNRWLSK